MEACKQKALTTVPCSLAWVSMLELKTPFTSKPAQAQGYMAIARGKGVRLCMCASEDNHTGKRRHVVEIIVWRQIASLRKKEGVCWRETFSAGKVAFQLQRFPFLKCVRALTLHKLAGKLLFGNGRASRRVQKPLLTWCNVGRLIKISASKAGITSELLHSPRSSQEQLS